MEKHANDIAHILQNKDFSVFSILISFSEKFRKDVAAKIEDSTAYEMKCTEINLQKVNEIYELQQEIARIKSEMDATNLLEKKYDKKILNTLKDQKILEEEIHAAKLNREALTLEIIDLQQAFEKRKETKCAKWSALKRVFHLYKHYLDCHIGLEKFKEARKIRVSFFLDNYTANNKYYVIFMNSNNQWKVESIKPQLDNQYLTDYPEIDKLPKQAEFVDVTAFLCRLRGIFKNYYINTPPAIYPNSSSNKVKDDRI